MDQPLNRCKSQPQQMWLICRLHLIESSSWLFLRKRGIGRRHKRIWLQRVALPLNLRRFLFASINRWHTCVEWICAKDFEEMEKIIYIIGTVLLLASAFGANAAESCFDETAESEARFVDCMLKAKLGFLEAQLNLGVMYYQGEVVSRDNKKAIKWMTKAAEQGFVAAKYNLGQWYREGKGITQDDKKAIEWMTKAADQGFLRAQHNLGVMYSDGDGVPQDYVKAAYWYNEAAVQGFGKSQTNLAMMYQKGLGMLQDYDKAVYWYSRAGGQGFPKAQHKLGLMYADEKGAFQDDNKAVEWYSKAEEQGNANAQFHLGLMFQTGKGGCKIIKKQ